MTTAAPMPRREAAALLGVAEDAAPQEVQRAYLRAARRIHPDVLPDADEAGRRAAGEAFARLTLARDVLNADRPPVPLQGPGRSEWAPRPGDPTGPRFRQVPGRGLGGSLIVLALLAFLLMALVGVEQGFVGSAFDGPGTSTTP